MRVLTLNACGIRASEKKGLFKWLRKQKSDCICLKCLEHFRAKKMSNAFITAPGRYRKVEEK